MRVPEAPVREPEPQTELGTVVSPALELEPQTELGTVRSLLPLEETDIGAVAPYFGDVQEGLERGTVRRWSAWDDGALHVVAWHELRAPQDMEARGAVEVAPGGSVRAWLLPTRELAFARSALDGRDRSARLSRPLVQRARLVVAPPGEPATMLVLACRPEDEVCRREDLAAPIETLVRSLRPGAPLGGGTWTVRVPDGPTHDALLTLTLPEDHVGLPLRRGSVGQWQALLVSLRSGSIVLRLTISLGAQGGGGTRYPVACAPYHCAWAPSAGLGDAADALLASVRRESVPAREEVALIEGRVGLLAAGPTEHDAADATLGVGASAVHRTHVRVPVSDTSAAVVDIRALDSLEAIAWPLQWPIDVGVDTLREREVDELPSADAAWSIFARRGSRGDMVRLFVLEHDGTALVLTARFSEPLGDAERAFATRAIAGGLRRLGPTRTTDRWRVSLGALSIDVVLPARFATTFDEALYEGWSAASAVYLGQPRSALVFTRGEELPRRRPRFRRAVTLGDLPIELGTYMRGASAPWRGSVPCGCGLWCTVEVRGDDAQREALIAALAAATIARRTGTVEDVQVRSGPSDDSDAVGRIWPSREVAVRRSQGEWVEIDGRDSGSSAAVHGWVHAGAIGEHCD